MPVPRLAQPGHLAGRDVQRGEQGGGAVPDVVVGAFLRHDRLHRQHRLPSGPRPGSGDFSSTHSTIAFSGGARYSPTMSVTFATSSGSVENLNVSDRHGCTPSSRHAFATVRCSTFRCAASNRDDQCVIPSLFGGGVSVADDDLATGPPPRPTRPGLIDQTRPSRRRRTWPARPITVGRDTPTRSAISVLTHPVSGQQHDPRPLRSPGPHRRGAR